MKMKTVTKVNLLLIYYFNCEDKKKIFSVVIDLY